MTSAAYSPGRGAAIAVLAALLMLLQGAGGLIAAGAAADEVVVYREGCALPDAGEGEFTIMLAGDVMLARSMERKIEETGPDYPFSRTNHAVRAADLAIANLECAVSDRGSPVPNKVYTFRADPANLGAVKDAGFDAVVLANNHIGDYGPAALNDTAEHCEDAGLVTSGLWYDGDGMDGRIPRPVSFLLERSGTPGPEVSLLSYTESVPSSFDFGPGTPGPVPNRMSIMREDVTAAGSASDIVVVSIHWSRMPQYVREADDGQKEMCRELVDAGADVVYCHGPHVLQEVEGYGGGLILYSLGNYVFDLAEESSHRGALAAVTVAPATVAPSDDGAGWSVERVELLPFDRYDYRPVPTGARLPANVTDGLWWDRADMDGMLKASTDWGRWSGSALEADSAGDGSDSGGGGDQAGLSGSSTGGRALLWLAALTVAAAFLLPAAVLVGRAASRTEREMLRKESGSGGGEGPAASGAPGRGASLMVPGDRKRD